MVKKLIEVSPFQNILTNVQSTIDKAVAEGYPMTDVVEIVREPIDNTQAKLDAKAEQDRINEEENKPNLIAALTDIPYQDMPEDAYILLSYEALSEYFSDMVGKQNLISEIIYLKYDITGTKTVIEKINKEVAVNQNKLDSINLKITNIDVTEEDFDDTILVALQAERDIIESDIAIAQLDLTVKETNLTGYQSIDKWNIEGAKPLDVLKKDIDIIRADKAAEINI